MLRDNKARTTYEMLLKMIIRLMNIVVKEGGAYLLASRTVPLKEGFSY